MAIWMEITDWERERTLRCSVSTVSAWQSSPLGSVKTSGHCPELLSDINPETEQVLSVRGHCHFPPAPLGNFVNLQTKGLIGNQLGWRRRLKKGYSQQVKPSVTCCPACPLLTVHTMALMTQLLPLWAHCSLCGAHPAPLPPPTTWGSD